LESLFFRGDFDDFGFWNRALTEEEILALYNSDPSISGCTDSTACNFDSEATSDDGSCVYPPIIELGGDLISCDEAVVIEAEDGFTSYTWSTGETTPAIEVSESGIISVEVSMGLEEISDAQEIEGFTHIGTLGQSHYYVSEASILWEAAKISCEMLGGHLVTISSAEENEWVWQGVYGNGLNPGGTNNYQAWIGLYQNVNSPDYSEPDGGWEWVTGEPLDYLNWASNQPNNSDQGYFAHMTDANGNCSEADPACGVWDDANISWNLQSAFYVLELGPTPAYCSTIDSLYVDLDHGSCFCGLNAFWDSNLGECAGQIPSSDACGPGTYWDAIESVCLPLTTCQEDLDGDGVIGVNDLMQLLATFGTMCEDPEPETGEFTCGDPMNYHGYDYATVQIGDQCWFAENLRTELYENGDEVPIVEAAAQWSSLTSGARRIYGSGDANCGVEGDTIGYCGQTAESVFALNGYLYNWHTVIDSRSICPSNWHVPNDVEFEVLLDEAGNWIQGTIFSLKSEEGWSEGNGGSNTSGFNALGSGYGGNLGNFSSDGHFTGFWSADDTGSSANASHLQLDERPYSSSEGSVFLNTNNKRYAHSVRCLKDTE
jgi:uncharacterized protein (TIGR02145 family)